MDKILQQVNELTPELIDGIKRIVRIPSVQDTASEDAPYGKNVRKALLETLKLSEELGFETVNIDNHIGYASFGPKNKEGYIAAIGHLDVVPVGEGWKHDPFSAYEEDGVIYSRGILDNKGPILSCLYALYALKQLGYKPHREIRIIFGCNEETGFHDLKYYLSKEQPPLAGYTPDCKFPVVYAERGRLVINVKCANTQELHQFLNAYVLNSDHSGVKLGIDFKNGEFGKLETRNDKIVDDKTFQFAISYPYGITCKELVERLKNKGFDVDVVGNYDPVYFNRKAPMISIMQEAYETVTGLDGTPVTTTGGTYAKLMPHIVPFGPSFPGQKGIGHNPNEWMKIDDIITITKIYALTLYRLGREDVL
ncbi:MAG: Sapep family Mn(2+)-dependent dipeptidase [Sharpea porci]|uniref:Sapep family Mn(2+)-dependent dipeptidase n=1 Tax=Sharpea porci TaxID=2652286 RepID=UPI002409877F|nr:Sapep family Mn(2+)-dependent dipeptidase [Sharpea porci]MDD6710777.1 Sapep family Mn(2+)-dependent dipeptidase [Sharpea porci]